ncbi:uncharacterized protein EV422DRAFT_399379 [Fimicolochytrium jonesii]|uniref:uncharacterized protein n=1 Tax=Fimicolochytrium jonesii TaxID=1396493 RepID=UPI0022FE8EBA|nr:uncharacterized protein EV422DRAFT_399379 [Fimicolochytrium jonesii]KAI8822463.1 hypothetical protein EV422DRAFT_399379 [Fimicolochytrium jonesii]
MSVFVMSKPFFTASSASPEDSGLFRTAVSSQLDSSGRLPFARGEASSSEEEMLIPTTAENNTAIFAVSNGFTSQVVQAGAKMTSAVGDGMGSNSFAQHVTSIPTPAPEELITFEEEIASESQPASALPTTPSPEAHRSAEQIDTKPHSRVLSLLNSTNTYDEGDSELTTLNDGEEGDLKAETSLVKSPASDAVSADLIEYVEEDEDEEHVEDESASHSAHEEAAGEILNHETTATSDELGYAPLPCVLLSYRGETYALFSVYQQNLDLRPIFEEEQEGSLLFESQLTLFIAGLKDHFEIENDITLQMPQLNLTFDENSSCTETLSVNRLYEFFLAHLTQKGEEETPENPLQIFLTENQYSLTNRLNDLARIALEAGFPDYSEEHDDMHSDPDSDGHDSDHSGHYETSELLEDVDELPQAQALLDVDEQEEVSHMAEPLNTNGSHMEAHMIGMYHSTLYFLSSKLCIVN